MLKKTVEYTDYNGNVRKEDFFFNLTKAELAEMNFSVSGGMERMLTDIIAAQDMPKIAAAFKEILMKSYGEKSADGRRFVKSEELSKAFSQTEAYSKIYMELLSDESGTTAADFVNGVFPTELANAVKAETLPAGA